MFKKLVLRKKTARSEDFSLFTNSPNPFILMGFYHFLIINVFFCKMLFVNFKLSFAAPPFILPPPYIPISLFTLSRMEKI